MSYIYKITNILTKSFYIGKTTKLPEDRLKSHIRASKYKNTRLHKAIRKHGINSFIIEILEEVSDELLNQRECYWIDLLNPSYNMTRGGDGGNTSKSENYINGMKTRNFNGENNPMYGKTPKNATPVTLYGETYKSLAEASRITGLSVHYIKKKYGIIKHE